jgi:uncharacterized protein
VEITYDPVKKNATFLERGLSFEDAKQVFLGKTVEVEDTRKSYGETRIICFGKLDGRVVVIGYTQRKEARHIFSMRKANQREQDQLGSSLDE